MPANLLGIAWKTLSLPLNEDHNNEVSLGPLLAISTLEEYEELLVNMVSKLQKDPNVSYTLSLWKGLITGQVFGKHGILKKEALEHVTLMIVGQLKTLDQHNEKDKILPYIETLLIILDSGMILPSQIKASALSSCLIVKPSSLEHDYFLEVSFIIIINNRENVIIYVCMFATMFKYSDLTIKI